MKLLKKVGMVLMIIAILLLILVTAFLLILKFYPPIGNLPDKEKRKEYAEKTDLYYDNKFHNENAFSIITGSRSEENERTVPESRIPVQKIESIDRADADKMKITWLGHSSVLVQMGEKNILLDPVLNEYCAPVSFAGYSRFSDLALAPEDVPDIDVLFISHDHYDHLDYNTIKAVDSKVSHYVVPLGVDVILKGWGVDDSKLHPLSWWESIDISGVNYTVVPSQHSSFRNPLHKFESLWGGIYIKNDFHSLYYTGDCGYSDGFKRIYERFGETELMLSDSAQYNDAWAQTHMTPEQAVQAAKAAHAKWLMPIHWGAFKLSSHPWDDPPKRAVAAAEEQDVSLATPRIGQTMDCDDISSFNEHWWEEYA